MRAVKENRRRAQDTLDNLLINVSQAKSHPNKDNYTHMTMNDNKLYIIDPMKLRNFYEGYCSLVIKSYTDTTIGRLSIAERINKNQSLFLPLINVFTFKFERPDYEDGDDEEEFMDTYDPRLILELVYCHQEVMREYLNINGNNSENLCVVLTTRNEYYDASSGFFRIHLQFPYCRVDVNIQRLMRNKIISLLRKRKVSEYFNRALIGDWDSHINHGIFQEPLLMYGSTASVPESTLIFDGKSIYGAVSEYHLENKQAPIVNLTQAFVPELHQDVRQHFPGYIHVSPDNISDYMFWLPLFLSIGYWDVITHAKDSVSLIPDKSIQIINVDSPSSSRMMHSDETDSYIAEKLVPLLSRERLKETSHWLDVGKALYNVYGGDDRGLYLWTSISPKKEGDSDGSMTANICEAYYDTFEDNRLTIKTIGYFARQDSPDEYATWHKEWCDAANKEALSVNHADVAKAFYRRYWLEYACTDTSSTNHKKIWFEYREPRWQNIRDGITIKRKISEDFCKLFLKVKSKLAAEMVDSTGRDSKMKATMEKEIIRLTNNLKNDRFKSTIMSAIVEFFYVENFKALLDSNENYMGTKNLVIETLPNKAIVRKGKPEDYISLSTGTTYPKDMHWKHESVQGVIGWYHQMFPNAELLHEVFKWQSSTLRGRNANKKLVVFTGDGDNGKSMFVKCNDVAFGQYSIPAPSNLLTEVAGRGGGPNPELARAGGRHQMWIPEPDEKTPISGAKAKALTGGDKLYARFLQDNGDDMEIFFNLIMHCNDIPPMTSGGKAAQERFMIIPFISLWSDEAPDDPKEQVRLNHYKRDRNFQENFIKKRWGQALIWILVQYYEIYIREGLKTPQIVKDVTNEYWDHTDKYRMFIKECLDFGKLPDGTPDPMKAISIYDLYKKFKMWHEETYVNNMDLPDRPIFESNMLKRLRRRDNPMIEVDGTIWKGVMEKIGGFSPGGGGGHTISNINIPNINGGGGGPNMNGGGGMIGGYGGQQPQQGFNRPRPLGMGTQPGVLVS